MGRMGQLPRPWAVREKPSFSGKGEGAHLQFECEPSPLNPLCLNTHSPTWHPVWEGGAFRRRSLAGGGADCGTAPALGLELFVWLGPTSCSFWAS